VQRIETAAGASGGGLGSVSAAVKVEAEAA
jgi:hypothetical protein